MAQKLNIDIVAKDKSKQALNGVQKSLGRLKNSVFNLRNAFLGLGAGLVIRNLVNTGKQLENLRVRLKFLLKDTNEGAKAFDNMTKFASKVPFSLEQIQSGAGILATVTDNAEDLQEMLEITGNVAAVTGLDFRTASEQIQRSFSAGIGAADLFREKGVRNMLGFKAGATVSIEETVAAFEKVFGKGGRFGSATNELANTFEGTLSMIGDKVFNFKKVLLEAGFFDELKNQFGDLDKFLENNSQKIDEIATAIGRNLAEAIIGAVQIGKDLIPFLSKVKDQLIGLKETFDSLPAVMKQAGIIGALLLGKKGILGLGLILKAIEKADEFGEKFGNKPLVLPEIKPFESELSIPIEEKTIKKVNEQLESSLQIINEFESELSIAIPSATEKAISKFREMNGGAIQDFEKKMSNIKMTIAEGINNGITTMSQGIARAVVFGEKLSDTLKNMAQQFLSKIISQLIEVVVRKGVELAIEKLITNEKRKQAALSAVGGGGSIFSAFGSFFGGGKASGGAVSKGQPYMVGEQGAELFVPNQSGQIQQSARGTGGGSTTVNFNINAVDASGFEDLLVRSRGTITQLINSAVNERGAKSII